MNDEIKPTVYVAVGAPGSGKSTWWEKGISEGLIPKKNSFRINMDTIRKDLTGDINDQSQNGLVAEIAHSQLLNCLSNKIPVIYWDNTSARPKFRKAIIKEARKANYRCVAIFFNLKFDTIIKRNNLRDRVVPEQIIQKMYDSIQLNQPTMDEGYDNIIEIFE